VVTLTVTDDTGTTGALNMTIDANTPPVAALSAACIGPTCTFDASGSGDPDGTIAAYSLSFGDGHSADFTTSLTASHTYATGTFAATLYVRDNGGAVAIRTTTVTVTNMLPVATFTYACSAFTCGFDGSGAADLDGNIQYYGWTFGERIGTTCAANGLAPETLIFRAEGEMSEWFKKNAWKASWYNLVQGATAILVSVAIPAS
jgi:PKD domain